MLSSFLVSNVVIRCHLRASSSQRCKAGGKWQKSWHFRTLESCSKTALAVEVKTKEAFIVNNTRVGGLIENPTLKILTHILFVNEDFNLRAFFIEFFAFFTLLFAFFPFSAFSFFFSQKFAFSVFSSFLHFPLHPFSVIFAFFSFISFFVLSQFRVFRVFRIFRNFRIFRQN